LFYSVDVIEFLRKEITFKKYRDKNEAIVYVGSVSPLNFNKKMKNPSYKIGCFCQSYFLDYV